MWSVILLLLTVSQSNAVKHYNIVAIDGGGIRGLIPGQVISYIEDEAYKIAEKKGYTSKPSFPQYSKDKKKMAMVDLFDMMAGTSTGSIIAAGLSFPDKTSTPSKPIPKYWAKDVIEIYSKKGE